MLNTEPIDFILPGRTTLQLSTNYAMCIICSYTMHVLKGTSFLSLAYIGKVDLEGLVLQCYTMEVSRGTSGIAYYFARLLIGDCVYTVHVDTDVPVVTKVSEGVGLMCSTSTRVLDDTGIRWPDGTLDKMAHGYQCPNVLTRYSDMGAYYENNELVVQVNSGEYSIEVDVVDVVTSAVFMTSHGILLFDKYIGKLRFIDSVHEVHTEVNGDGFRVTLRTVPIDTSRLMYCGVIYSHQDRGLERCIVLKIDGRTMFIGASNYKLYKITEEPPINDHNITFSPFSIIKRTSVHGNIKSSC